MKDWKPYLITANKGGLTGVNLLSGETEQLLTVRPDERILSSFETEFVTLLADNRHAYFLKKQGTQTYLSICDLLTARSEDYLLGKQPVAGPFLMGGRICVYSENSLEILEQKGLKEYPLPRNFKALLSPESSRDLRLPSGRMPFMTRGNSVYIPGRQENLLSTNSAREMDGLLFYTLKDGRPNSNFIAAEGATSYSQDSQGRPLLIRSGKITRYEDAGQTLVRQDEQFIPFGPAFSENDLIIGYAKSGGGSASLRFYQGANTFDDYPLAYLSDFVGPWGFYQTMANLAFVYWTPKNFMRLVVWDRYAG